MYITRAVSRYARVADSRTLFVAISTKGLDAQRITIFNPKTCIVKPGAKTVVLGGLIACKPLLDYLGYELAFSPP